MKKIISKILLLGVATVASIGLFSQANTYADEEGNVPENIGTSISLTPVSKILQIASNSVYDGSFALKNSGETQIRFEVYAAPYSYVYSEDEDLYKLGFSNENNYTQIARWITFLDTAGNYVKTTTFTIEPQSTLEVKYRISTPASIPNGGQYAVIFAHTLSDPSSQSGIRTEASPGMVVYGRSTEGEAIISADITDLEINRGVTENGTTRDNFYASAKVKNTGNVDFSASGVLKVEPILGGASYETPAVRSRLSVIPEAELVISDEWQEMPSFGLYKITWTVTVGDNVESIEKVVFLISPAVIIITIILLTIIIVWIIIGVRKRKERRSRLAV